MKQNRLKKPCLSMGARLRRNRYACQHRSSHRERASAATERMTAELLERYVAALQQGERPVRPMCSTDRPAFLMARALMDAIGPDAAFVTCLYADLRVRLHQCSQEG